MFGGGSHHCQCSELWTMGCEYLLAPRALWVCCLYCSHHHRAGVYSLIRRCQTVLRNHCAESCSHLTDSHSDLGFLFHLGLNNVSLFRDLSACICKCLFVAFAHFSIGLRSFPCWMGGVLSTHCIPALCWLELLRILSVCDLCLLSSLCLFFFF